MKILVVGTGYVGLVTGVCLSDIGHEVTCFDISSEKIDLLKSGRSPIYEPGLEQLMEKNVKANKLFFTSNVQEAYQSVDCIFIAVGTPETRDGSADLTYVEEVALTIAESIKQDTIVVIKSTVPVGTNDYIERLINERTGEGIKVHLVSNPEFLREGSAIKDTFEGSRIVIGSNSQEAGDFIEEIYSPLSIPIVRTDIRSAEMIKYASNAFLATKISFINEVANLCEKTGANVEEVAVGMGFDKRIGNQFLKAGIGFGGSCFPKDTKALISLANEYDSSSYILDAVLKVNDIQKKRLVEKVKDYFIDIQGKKAAILGLAFKPNTNDIREAPSLELIDELLSLGTEVHVYDPIALENVKEIYGDRVYFHHSIDEAIENADMALLVTEWREVKGFPLKKYKELMKRPVVFDGRNVLSPFDAKKEEITYFSIGR
ncbi:UDP-glucose/GDP-mannose dehydrogenase family protein [Rossellomorea sp. KS-H15a]|uniref:UDP-glucose dehydrogenase family protein n=1 Tax=Rossellomorea sp. KS-H15a TaxID=2963940 RepID=UPI0020C6BA64|nr:UDP-glucose/GDP-mannose dehydrogenase family protein [Rossellomorea sp. KS-H15a]UTE77360.1 UDP-glucose/GDP-mannose dehydrogenase family protein [Rossellomorea sp. KS-H15a]